jgi:predicted enzyme related to lactoylglutathione lyase
VKHLVNWVEIPVRDLERASAFYGRVLGVELQKVDMGGARYAMFPTEDHFNAGALVQTDGHHPAADGTLVYLDGGRDLAQVLAKVAAAGGKIVMPKTFLSKEAGWIGLFIDCEGNRIGLQHL